MASGGTGGDSGGSTGGGYKYEIPVTVDGQTVFTLPDYPADPFQKFWIELNGQTLLTPYAFTLSGLTLTWLNPYQLRMSDTLYFCYF
jgi:hypothetical protein